MSYALQYGMYLDSYFVVCVVVNHITSINTIAHWGGMVFMVNRYNSAAITAQPVMTLL